MGEGTIARSTWVRVLLALVLAALVVRLGIHVASFGRTSLQMDFAAFYTAGESVNHGLSPYLNHVDHDPPIWDGVNQYRHSRFLYPPLAARLFQPLALLPYNVAKQLWIVVALLALVGSMLLSVSLAGLKRLPGNLLVLGIVAAAWFPLLALLERGQIDSLTLLLVLGSIHLARTRRYSLAGGLLLAVATLLKLHCVFLVPFLLLRRRWATAQGFLAGAAALLLLSLLIDGYAPIASYVRDDLPRISRYGEGGTREMRLPPQQFRRVAGRIGPDRTVMDGREYRPEALTFVLNASLVRTPAGRATWSAVNRLGLPIAPAQVSLIFLAVAFVLVLLWWLWRGRRDGENAGEDNDFAYWQIALVLIVLCAPVSWAMGAVWLLPASALVLRGLPNWRDPRRALALATCIVGLFLAGAPDRISGLVLGLFGPQAGAYKYVVAELLLLAGCVASFAPLSMEKKS